MSVNNALAAMISRMEQFERMLHEYERRAKAERSREEASTVSKREDNFSIQIVTAILKRLAAMEIMPSRGV